MVRTLVLALSQTKKSAILLSVLATLGAFASGCSPTLIDPARIGKSLLGSAVGVSIAELRLTAPTTLTAGDCSGALVISARDSGGMVAISNTDLNVTLSSTLTPAQFFSDSSCAGGAITTTQILKGESGKTVYFRSTKAGTHNVSVAASGVTGDTQVTTVDAASADHLELVAGDAQTQLVNAAVSVDPAVRVVDEFGNPVAGEDIAFVIVSGGGSVSVSPDTSDAAGAASTSWTLGGVAGAQSMRAERDGTALPGVPATITFTATAQAGAVDTGNSSIVASGGPVTADGTDTATITITLLDADSNPITGITPTFAATDTGSTNVYGACSATNGSGVSTCTLASTKAEVKTVSLTGPAVIAGNTVTFIPGAVSAAESTIAASPTTVTADGVSTSAITITLRDAYQNPIPGLTATFSATGSGNTLVQPGAVTDANGQASGTIASTAAGVKAVSISAPAGLGAVSVNVTFVAGSMSLANSSLTVSPAGPIVANGSTTYTVTLTIHDANNNPISGESVVLTASGTNNTITTGLTGTTNASGEYSYTIASTKAETKNLGVTTPAALSGLTNTAVFTHGPATKLVVATQPSDGVAGVALPTQPVIEVRDANDNVVTSGVDATATLTASLQSGTGTLSGTVTRAAVAGVASYAGNDLRVNLQGGKVLRFTKPDLSGSGGAGVLTVDSDTFQIQSIACDSGTLATTCTISTVKDVPTGVAITGAGNLVVANGGNIRHLTNAADISIVMGGDITVQSGGKIESNVWPMEAENIDVQSGGEITASRLGYLGGRQPGNATNDGLGAGGGTSVSNRAGGGGYAVVGGNPDLPGGVGGTTYGDASNPTDYGSGGASATSANLGGNGGGRLWVRGLTSVTIGGNIVSNGGNGTSGGGGSGGTLFIDTLTASGSGTLSARGGNGDWSSHGYGGAGRIRYKADKLFTGTVALKSEEYGNSDRFSPRHQGRPYGSFYVELPTADSICDTGTLGATCTITRSVKLGTNQSSISGSNFTIANGARLQTVGTDHWITFELTGDFTLGGELSALVAKLQADDVIIQSTGRFHGNLGGTNAATHPGLIAQTLSVASGSIVSANAMGHWPSGLGAPSLQGPGNGVADATGTWSGSGGGHGGAGGANHEGMAGGGTYGDPINPRTYGSAGGDRTMWEYGGNGGGIIAMDVTGVAAINGIVRSNGEDGRAHPANAWSSGGGAGGSINIRAGSFSGSGSVTVDGGNATSFPSTTEYAGGGGGGRILLHRLSGSAFGGTLSAAGGLRVSAPAMNGSAGTALQVPGAASALTSTITGSGPVVANGVAESTITITIKDENGFGVFGVTPTFSATDTGSTNSYGACSVTNGSGVSTCTLKSTKAESKTLSLSTPVAVVGGNVSFTHGPATKLAFTTQPPEVKAGSAFSPQPVVTIQDAFDNVVTTGADATVTITLSLQSGTGALTGTLTEAAVAGVANFTGNGITPTLTGNKVIRAATMLSGPVTVHVDSNTVTIVPINCSSGTLATTCTISGAETVADGVVIEGANITIANGGNLNNATNKQTYSINLTGDLVIQSGGQLRGNVTVNAANITVDTGGTITAVALGYRGGGTSGLGSANGEGPGGGLSNTGGPSGYRNGGGGGHAGAGGNGHSTTGGSAYDVLTNPADFGSGGGQGRFSNGGHGGGRLLLTATSTATINGTVSANGGNGGTSGGAGGAGGSIKITAATLSGTGTLSATGGDGNGYPNCGSGSGGIIYLDTPTSYAGTIAIETGSMDYLTNGTFGALGSFRANLPSADALCDSGNWASTCVISTAKNLPENYFSLSGSNLNISSTGKLIIPSRYHYPSITLTGDLQLDGEIAGSIGSLTADDVVFGATGKINGNVGAPPVATYPGMSVATLTLPVGAKIDATAWGYQGGYMGINGSGIGQGPGGGARSPGLFEASGGGYGGEGQNEVDGTSTPGAIYGTASAPDDFGSGGGGGAYGAGGASGGGMIRITTTGAVTLNGELIAAGGLAGSNSSGGGSGGTIYLDAASLSGSGALNAKGGNSNGDGGAGGGGRIYVSAPTPFAGTINVSRGNMALHNAFDVPVASGTGTYYLDLPSTDAYCDSGSVAGTCTISTKKILATNHLNWSGGALTIASGGELWLPSPFDWLTLTLSGDLTIDGLMDLNTKSASVDDVVVGATGQWLGNIGAPDTVNYPGLSAASVSIASGGRISAERRGDLAPDDGFNISTRGAGRGTGVSDFGNGAGGASHCGAGGNGSTAGVTGAAAYDSPTNPIYFGSAGSEGGYSAWSNSGGGILRMSVSGTLTNDGILNADGGAAFRSSGASGGTINVAANAFSGTGTYSAIGGSTTGDSGGDYSGGGGGGCIALVRSTGGAVPGGQINVSGGTAIAGATAGGVGSAYQN